MSDAKSVRKETHPRVTTPGSSRLSGKSFASRATRRDHNRPVRHQSADALVLGTYPLREKDRIVSFLTRDAGKKRGVARGARGTRNAYSGALEPMTEARIFYFEKDGQELVSINSADILRSSFPLSKDLDRGLLVSAMAESLQTFVSEDDPAEPFYRLARHALDALFAGTPATYDGPSVHLRDARLLPAPVQARIPVWVGGKGGPRLLRLAARHADGWNAVWRWSPEAFGDRAEAARAACEDVGRDPASFRFTVGLYALIGEEEEGARDAFERGRAAMPGNAMSSETYESWCADTLSGTPDRIVERVRAFEAIGVEEIVVAPWVLPFAIPEPAQVELFAERVLRPLRAGA